VELMAAENQQRNRRLNEIMEGLAHGLARLLHIAEIPEHRITDLEGGAQ